MTNCYLFHSGRVIFVTLASAIIAGAYFILTHGCVIAAEGGTMPRKPIEIEPGTKFGLLTVLEREEDFRYPNGLKATAYRLNTIQAMRCRPVI